MIDYEKFKHTIKLRIENTNRRSTFDRAVSVAQEVASLNQDELAPRRIASVSRVINELPEEELTEEAVFHSIMQILSYLQSNDVKQQFTQVY